MNLLENNDVSNQKMALMHRMIFNSSRVTHEINRRMKQELNLSLAKFEALIAIENAPDDVITMSNLSKELSVSNANITGMINRLLADGLVLKKALPTDRRIYCVTISDKGRTMLENAMEMHTIWVKELMESVNSEDVNFMNKIMDKMDRQTTYFENCE